jgi:hypothetical protein
VPVCFDARQSDVCVYGEKAAPLDTDGYSQAVAFSCKDHGADKSHANAGGQAAVAFQTRGSNLDIGDISGTIGSNADRASGGAPMIAQAFDLRGREGGAQFEGPHDTANIRAASGGSSRSYVAFAQNSRDEVRIQGDGDICGALSAEPGMKQTTYVASVAPTMRAGGKETGGARPYGTDADTCDSLVGETWAVRRLTPRECERLQGVPDDYSAIPWRGKPAEECPDGPRYRALGNSWAVPVVRWIGERLARELDVVKDREKPRP